jgi:hypothetical protein
VKTRKTIFRPFRKKVIHEILAKPVTPISPQIRHVQVQLGLRFGLAAHAPPPPRLLLGKPRRLRFFRQGFVVFGPEAFSAVGATREKKLQLVETHPLDTHFTRFDDTAYTLTTRSAGRQSG